jgi:hypothetical protein
LLRDIPDELDLAQVTNNDTVKLEKALALMQQARTEESDQVVTELEDLINQIHLLTGEYRT